MRHLFLELYFESVDFENRNKKKKCPSGSNFNTENTFNMNLLDLIVCVFALIRYIDTRNI